MITYIDKGPGLDARITQAGHWAVNVNGVWHASDDGVVQTLIDSYTLDQAKDWVKKQIDAHAGEVRSKFMAGVSPAEMAGWSIKRAEAYAYQASGNAADAPMLGAEAAVRGVALSTVVARVIANATTLAGLEAAIAGVAGKHKDAIGNAADYRAVADYDWHTGWPA